MTTKALVLFLFGFLFFLGTSVSIAQNDSLDKKSSSNSQTTSNKTSLLLQKMLTDFKKVIPHKKFTVVIGNFYYEDSKISSAFALHLKKNLSKAIGHLLFIEEFSSRRLGDVIKKQKLNKGLLFDEDGVFQLKKIRGLDGLLVGNYSLDKKGIKLTLKLIQVRKGKSLLEKSAYLPRKFLPKTMGIKPRHFDQTQKILKNFSFTHYRKRNKTRGLKVVFISRNLPMSNFAAKQNSPFQIRVGVDRGNGAVYQLGDKLTVYFTSNRKCYLRLYHISALREVQQIFPLPGMARGNQIEANRTYTIPRSSDNFTFQMTRPLGTEIIKAIASTHPFQSGEESFQNLGKANVVNMERILSRGLNIVKKNRWEKPKVTEDVCTYTIVK